MTVSVHSATDGMRVTHRLRLTINPSLTFHYATINVGNHVLSILEVTMNLKNDVVTNI